MQQLLWGAEFWAALPYIYTVKLWRAHTEFMEDLLSVVS